MVLKMEFRNLKVGNKYVVGGNTYMKIHWVLRSPNFAFNCVDINSGELFTTDELEVCEMSNNV